MFFLGSDLRLEPVGQFPEELPIMVWVSAFFDYPLIAFIHMGKGVFNENLIGPGYAVIQGKAFWIPPFGWRSTCKHNVVDAAVQRVPVDEVGVFALAQNVVVALVADSGLWTNPVVGGMFYFLPVADPKVVVWSVDDFVFVVEEDDPNLVYLQRPLRVSVEDLLLPVFQLRMQRLEEVGGWINYHAQQMPLMMRLV